MIVSKVILIFFEPAGLMFIMPVKFIEKNIEKDIFNETLN